MLVGLNRKHIRKHTFFCVQEAMLKRKCQTKKYLFQDAVKQYKKIFQSEYIKAIFRQVPFKIYKMLPSKSLILQVFTAAYFVFLSISISSLVLFEYYFLFLYCYTISYLEFDSFMCLSNTFDACFSSYIFQFCYCFVIRKEAFDEIMYI